MKLTAQMEQKIKLSTIPVNLGRLIYVDDLVDTLSVLESLKNGTLGIAGEDSSIISGSFNKYTKKPTRPCSEIDRIEVLNENCVDAVKVHTADQAEKWGISGRGKIRRGQIADILLFRKNSQGQFELSTVLIKGHPVWHQGSRTGGGVVGERWF